MSKYYTPTIEEFHVGFEYRLYHPVVDTLGVSRNGLKSHTNEVVEVLDWEFTDLYNNIKDELIDVKYLDKEDIESLDWKFDEDETSCLAFVKNIWDLWYYERKQLLTIESEETGIIFKGYIKNKSELKKLLKQLNIDG